MFGVFFFYPYDLSAVRHLPEVSAVKVCQNSFPLEQDLSLLQYLFSRQEKEAHLRRFCSLLEFP